MKMLLYVCAALMFSLAPLTAHATTDVTGTWIGTLEGGGGGGGPISFALKQSDTTLTGTIDAGMGDPLVITEGKVDGDKISFKVSFNGAVITNEGTINGDEIKLTSKSDGGDFAGGEITLKRAKQPPTP